MDWWDSKESSRKAPDRENDKPGQSTLSYFYKNALMRNKAKHRHITIHLLGQKNIPLHK